VAALTKMKVAGYVIGVVASLGTVFTAHLVYSGHYKKVGRLACEAKTAEANAKTVPIVDDAKNAKDTAENDFTDKTETIRTEVRTGITALDLARAQREAQNTGEELGRARAIAEYRAAGGCMSDPLPGDDGLLVVGKDQQRAIFGYVVGSVEDPETEKVRRDPAPD